MNSGGTTRDSLVYLLESYVFYWGGQLEERRILWKKCVDNLCLMSYREEIASESQNE